MAKKCTIGYKCSATCISKSKDCISEFPPKIQKTLDKAVEEIGNIGEFTIAWKIGQIGGTVLAKAAEAHGVPSEIASMVAPAVVQGLASTGIEYLKDREASPRELTDNFLQETFGAMIDANLSTFTGGMVETLGGVHTAEIVGDFIEINRAALVQQSRNALNRASRDVETVTNMFKRLSSNVQFSEDNEPTKEELEAIGRLMAEMFLNAGEIVGEELDGLKE